MKSVLKDMSEKFESYFNAVVAAHEEVHKVFSLVAHEGQS